MAIRNRHRIGDYLMVDDESGFTHYASDMRRIWNGTFRRRNQFETRQPQEFVRAGADPRALRHIRPEDLSEKVCDLLYATKRIGDTDPSCGVRVPQGPAYHIFDRGVGEAEIGCTFQVRTDDPSHPGIGIMQIGCKNIDGFVVE